MTNNFTLEAVYNISIKSHYEIRQEKRMIMIFVTFMFRQIPLC